MPCSGGSLRISQHSIAPFLSGRPLPSPAIRSLTTQFLNRTQVDAAHSVVLSGHTRVLSLSYFSCPSHTLVWGLNTQLDLRRTSLGIVRWANSLACGDRCTSDCFAAIPRKRNRQTIGYL